MTFYATAGHHLPCLLRIILGVLAILSTQPARAEPPLQIRSGNSSYGEVVMNVDGSKVRLGNSAYGPVLFNIDGDKIREGNSQYGRVVATADSNGRIHQGNGPYGKTIATVTGNRVREGNSEYGRTIANTDGGRMSGAAAASLLLLR